MKAVLKDLIEAGLGSLPGGGAEVFVDRVHDEALVAAYDAARRASLHAGFEAELARQMGGMAVGLPHGWVMQVLRPARSPT